MSLIPYNPNDLISSIMRIVDSATQIIAGRFSQRKNNQIMRDQQLKMIQIEMSKIEVAFKMHAVNDLTRVAFEEMQKTAEEFAEACRETPALADVSAYLLKMQATYLSALIESFFHGECGPYPLLPCQRWEDDAFTVFTADPLDWLAADLQDTDFRDSGS